jgi:hypothetical protein
VFLRTQDVGRLDRLNRGGGATRQEVESIRPATSVFHDPGSERAEYPRDAELAGFIAYDARRHIREQAGTTRTMVTILRLRGIQPFGFRVATGPVAARSALPSEAKTGILRRSLSDSSRCGANLRAAIQLRH